MSGSEGFETERAELIDRASFLEEELIQARLAAADVVEEMSSKMEQALIERAASEQRARLAEEKIKKLEADLECKKEECAKHIEVAAKEAQKLNILKKEYKKLKEQLAIASQSQMRELPPEPEPKPLALEQLELENAHLKMEKTILSNEVETLRQQVEDEHEQSQQAMQEQFRAAQQQIHELREKLKEKDLQSGRNRMLSLAGHIHESWMYKQGDLVKSFRKRWFVLTITNMLHYYEGPSDKKPKGTIELTNVKEVRFGESKPDLPTPFVIEVVTAGRTYILCAETEVDQKIWVTKLKSR